MYAPSRDLGGGSNAIYGIPTKALEVNTGPTEHVTIKSATITGVVTPKEAPEATAIEFEWGPKGEVSKNKVPANVTSTTSEVHVHAELTGLEPGVEYEYRLVATAGTETIQGTVLPLDTLPLATVTTESASEVKIESATLNGKIVVSPEVEEKGEYYFEYTPEGGLATTTAKTPFTGEEVMPSVPVSSLEAGKKYHYQLVVFVEGHEIKGMPVVEFTPPALATATTEPATEVQPESAKLNGTLTLDSEVTEGEYYFEYTPEGGLAATTPAKPFTTSGKVSEAVTLESHQNYAYRVIVIAKGHKIEGTPVVEFTTPPPKPVVTYQTPTVSRHEATLSAEVNTEGISTNYVIEWGENAQYGGTKSGKIEAELAASAEPSKITQALIELEPGTTYHYRIVATNSTGTTEGEDATFKTAAPQPPAVESESAVQVAQTTATIVASVNPNGLQTSYALEVGTEVEENGVRRIAYTPTFGEVGEGAENLTLPLSGLLPGTTYHYRVVLTNEDGKAGEEADQTFTTPGFPAVITPPALVTLVPFTMPKEVKPGPVVETRAEKYTKAVQLCQKIKSKKKRAACMKTAKKKYGPVAKKKHKKK